MGVPQRFSGGIIGGLVGGLFVYGIGRIWRRPMQQCLRQELNKRGIPICMKCGYDLRGQVEPRCPECGTDFDSELLSEPES